MALPKMITLIRHGESEANVAQKLVKEKRFEELPETFEDRHDSFMRLTPEGVMQAKTAGEFLKERIASGEIEGFDRFYVSPHVRTRETAAHLKLDGKWLVDVRFRERDWGSVVSHRPMDLEERKLRNLHEFYWQPPGGESIASGLRLRVESIIDTLYRRQGVDHVVAVSHGEFIYGFQTVVERLTPEAFLELQNDSRYKMRNTMIVQYSSVNPENEEETSNHYRWRRAICPWNREFDWDNGEWVDTNPKMYSDDELLDYVELQERLLEGN